MTAFRPPLRRRVLVIDDSEAVLADFQQVFQARVAAGLERDPSELEFAADTASQGADGQVLMQRAMLECDPYAVAFVDLHMPPGWDGIHTAQRLWEIDPELPVVICVDSANCPWAEVAERFEGSPRLLVLRKPFERILVQRLARTLAEKWHLAQQARCQQARLEHQVLDRTRQLRAAQEAAETASAAKNEFLSMMSHEIRTPMNGLIGLSSLLADECRDPAVRDLAVNLRQSADHLMEVLGSILDFSETAGTALKLAPTEFIVDDLLAAVLDGIALPAARKQLMLGSTREPSLPPLLVGDVERLRQLLGGLASNAVKFTDRGSVTLHAGAVRAEAAGWQVRFEVRDTGNGIPPGHQARLFKAFSPADSSLARKHGGLGLGLAICKRLVDAMGGTIGFTSTPGLGSTFWFVVRLGRAESAPGLQAKSG